MREVTFVISFASVQALLLSIAADARSDANSSIIQEKSVSFKNVSTIIPILLAAFILQYSHETRRREVIGLTAAEQKDIYAIGVRVYNLRKDLGLTREALAGICDLSVNTIASIESGAKDIKATTLMKIASALGCTADYLLYGTGDAEAVTRKARLRALCDRAVQELDEKKLAGYTDQMESLLRMLAAL